MLLLVFGEGSSIVETFKEGEEVHVLGNANDKFENAQVRILGALTAAGHVLEFAPKLEKPGATDFGNNKKVFIVHGHDERLKNQVELFLKEFALEPIILHRQPDEGLTIIEKIEKYDDVGYALILLTPDDVAYSASEEGKDDSKRNKEKRARQNVIFEFGYFVGRLGRGRVCCVYKRGVSLPTDISGMLYKEVKDNFDEVALPVLKELKAAGYAVTI